MGISTLQKSVPALVSAVQETSLKLKTYDLGFFKVHDTNGNQRLDPDQDKITFHPEESKYFQHPLEKDTLGWVDTYGKASPAPYSAHIVSFIKRFGMKDYSSLSHLAFMINLYMAAEAAKAGYTGATNRAQGRALDYDPDRGKLFNTFLYVGDYRHAHDNSIRLYLNHAEKSAKAGRIPLAVQALAQSLELVEDHNFNSLVIGGDRIKFDLPKNLRAVVSGNIEKHFAQAQAEAQKKGPEAAKKVFDHLNGAYRWSKGFQQKFNCQRAVALALKTGKMEPRWFSEYACRSDSVPEKRRGRELYNPWFAE